MSSTQEPSDAPESTEPTLCVAGCGFFGNASTNNYCSKCYREFGAKKAKVDPNVSSSSSNTEEKQEISLTPASSSAPSGSASLLSTIPTNLAPPMSKSAAPSPSLTSEPASSPDSFMSIDSGSGIPGMDLSGKVKQKKKNRCFTCRRKVGIVGFDCRCGYVFCAQHRYPQTHDCEFDHKEHQKNNIEKLNPKLETVKVDKI